MPPLARYYLAKELTAATRPPGHDRGRRREPVQHDRGDQGAQPGAHPAPSRSLDGPTRPPSDLVPPADAADLVDADDAVRRRRRPDPARCPPARSPRPIPPTSSPLAMFSLEGRRVPALYLIGWVGTVMGLAVILVSFMATGAGAGWLFLLGAVVLGARAGGSRPARRRSSGATGWTSPTAGRRRCSRSSWCSRSPWSVSSSSSRRSRRWGSMRARRSRPRSRCSSRRSRTSRVVRVLVVGPGSLSWAEMGVRRPERRRPRAPDRGALRAPGPGGDDHPGRGAGLVPRAVAEPAARVRRRRGLVFNLVSAAVLAPIGEELFFRGFATTAWARAFGAWPAIIRGAVFFAIAHVLALFDADFAIGAQRALFSSIALLPVGIALGLAVPVAAVALRGDRAARDVQRDPGRCCCSRSDRRSRGSSRPPRVCVAGRKRRSSRR